MKLLLLATGAAAVRLQDASVATLSAEKKVLLEEAMDKGDSIHSENMVSLMKMHEKSMSAGQAWHNVNSRENGKNIKDLHLFQQSTREVTEEQITLAREKMNDELVAAWKTLDHTLAECSNEWNMNKRARDQSREDLRMIEATDQEASALETGARDEGQKYGEELQHKREELGELEEAWDKRRTEMDDDIAAIEADMAVNMFILSVTGELVKANPPAFNQMTHVPKQSLVQSGVEVCYSKDGKTEYKFMDKRVQAKLSALRAKSRALMEQAMRDTYAEAAQFSFVQLASTDVDNEEEEQAPGDGPAPVEAATGGGGAAGPAAGGSSTPPPIATAPAPAAEPVQESDPYGARRRCQKGAPARFGLLHDRMSALFGITADELSDKKKQLAKETAEYEKKAADLNAQIKMYSALVSDAESVEQHAQLTQDSLATAREENQAMYKNLEDEKKEIMDDCEERIHTIMKDEVCSVKMVRDEIQKKSKTDKVEDIQDCVVENGFIEGPCQDPMSGKDMTCDHRGDGKGGKRMLTRATLIKPNHLGATCPDVAVEVGCGKNACPVDCRIAKRRPKWSQCNKLCDGGNKIAVKTVKRWPKHGGALCPPLSMVRNCNQKRCNVDCTIGTRSEKLKGMPRKWKWSDWTPCSKACSSKMAGAGVSEKRRIVLKESIGAGKCWGKYSWKMRQTKACNEDVKCAGDEVCSAKMDVVFLIDSSGSVGGDNYKKMGRLVEDITKRLKKAAYGNAGVMVAAVQYGNGFVNVDEGGANGDSYSITPAKQLAPWTFDYEGFAETVKSSEHARGFTNLAQGYLAAQEMFDFPAEVQGARHDANFKKIIVLTDGTVSFKREAQDAFETVDSKGTRVNMVIFGGETYDKEIKNMVTRPHGQSIMHRERGFEELADDTSRSLVASDIITAFCPVTESPKKQASKDLMRGFKLWKKDQTCMSWYTDATVKAAGAKQDWFSWSGVSLQGMSLDEIKSRCAAAALEMGGKAFEVGLDGKHDEFMYGVCLIADTDAERGAGGCDGIKAWWRSEGGVIDFLPHEGLNVYKVMDDSDKEAATAIAVKQGV